MTGIEVVFLIVGFLCICISFFVANQKKEQKEEERMIETSSVWTEKEEQRIRERVDTILQECQDELVDATEDKMSRMCNDKIMAVDEFSRSILEKIENNHQEVVFMYNMLNEKEKDIKELLTKRVVTAEPEYENSMNRVEHKEKTALEKMQEKKTESRVMNRPEKKVAPSVNVSGDRTAKIQKLYKEGKSVLEISKQLNIGQGEVKLVIALYGGNRA